MSLTTSPIFLYDFGPFRLDLREAVLLRDGDAIALPPKSFEVLAFLVGRAGTLVEKDALMREVWPDTFIEEANVSRHIWTLRQALGDHGSGAAYIETVPKRGYRFIAPVKATGATDAAPGDATRLILLPFRWLRPDVDLEFLSSSLPEAVASALTGVEGLAVRSSLVAARVATDPPDFARIASEAAVTAVVAGTILRSGDRVRVTTQLVAAPSGTVMSTAASEASVSDLFQLQDALVSRIVESLAGPLIANNLRRDVPASAPAYEWYLRANRLAQDPATFEAALELYRRCVDADPHFAPAWARLGRLHRVMAKYTGNQTARLHLAEDALQRAIMLNPTLSIAHNQRAYLEVDLGRAREAMVGLIARARHQRHEAELFAGLVHACRYNGLLEASIRAHRRAIALDPLVPTSAVQSYWMGGDLDTALAESAKLAGGSLHAMVLAFVGRDEEAIAVLKAHEARLPQFLIRQFSVALRTLLEGDRDGCRAAIDHIQQADFADPEGSFILGRYLAKIGEHQRAQEAIAAAVGQGFAPAAFIRADPWLTGLHGTAQFERTARLADLRHGEAASAYRDAGGIDLLG
jgi:DNA-binding winged helix-turn-helix (wHTH) protein/tetratricopeptide (TPR) repeat protein